MAGQEEYHPSLDDPHAWVPYRYYPNLPAAVIFAVLFGAITGAHGIYMFRRRTWYFTPFIVGGCFEVAGYIGRAVSTDDIWALGPFIVQSILLLVAPALFAASIYIVLGRIIRSVHGEELSLVPVRWLTRTFVLGDVVAFLLQMGGGGIQAAGTLQTLKIGEKIIVAGLFAQIVFFGFFVVVAGLWHYRFLQHQQRVHGSGNAIWKNMLYALYGGSGLIMARSIFRAIEYLMGNNGYLLRHEYYLYIFDAALMFLEMVLFLVYHPSKLNSRGTVSEEDTDTELVQSTEKRRSRFWR